LHRTCTRVSRFVFAAGWLVAALATAPAAHAGWTLDKLAFEGDADPVAGVLNQMVGEVAIDASGRVTFTSYAWDGVDARIKIYSVVGGSLAIEVAKGDTAPGTGGATFVDVNRGRIAAPGFMAWLGLYVDGLDVKWGAFRRNGGGDAALVLPGAAAPGGGVVSKVQFIHAANASEAVAFGAEIDDGGPSQAQFVHDGSLREIFRDGTAAPAGVGGTFSGVQSWWTPVLASDGSVVFYGDIAGGSAASGLFRASPAGAITTALLEGDAVTTPGGGTFTGFLAYVGGNAAGDAIFEAAVLRAPETIFSRVGVFALEGGVQREIVFRGDPLPGTSPPRFFRGLAGSTSPALNASGDAAFSASIEDEDGLILERALVAERNGVLQVVAKEGDPVPGVPGDTFSDFVEVRMDDAGRIAFYAFTQTGSGVFLASPAVPVPATPGWALVVTALALLAGAAGLAGRRARTRSDARI